jgi:peptide/nickel transport system substrate-binding protein
MRQSALRRITTRVHFCVIAGAVCLGACSFSDESVPSPAQSAPVTLTIGFPNSTGQDPSYGAAQAARLISFEGLSGQNLSGRPFPRLAESWSESPDGLLWTIRLRPSAVFHDGTPVDAVAVKKSLERFLKSSAGQVSLGLQDISSIEVLGNYALTLRLRRRSTLLLDDLDTPISKVDSNGSTVGTGPYVVTSSSPDEIYMTAFPQYYRAEPTITRLVWRVYPTLRTAWAATMRGEVDFLYEVGPESREFLQFEDSVELYPFLRNYVYGLVFNARRPMFRNAEVRKALNYAIDRPEIVGSAFRGHATIANGPAWPLHWASDPAAPMFAYDPARAAASMAKEGTKGRTATGGISNLRFVCLIPQNFQLWERLALMVQRDLAEIGVDMALQAVPFEEFNNRLATGNFDAVLMEMISGFSVSRPFAFWHSTGLHSFSGYRNSAVDAAVERVKEAERDSTYREAFAQFQQAMFDDPPAIFLAWGQTARAVSRRFEVVKAPGGDIRTTISDWRLAEQGARVAN